MTALFAQQKSQPLVPVVNPADTQNRLGEALANKLAAGGSNADATSANNVFAPVGGARAPTLTGLA